MENQKNEALKWLNARVWAKGLKLQVHSSASPEQFYRQYTLNTLAWDKAFAYLRDTDFDQIPEGKYILLGDDVFVSVAEGPTKEIENTRWEAHKKYIDIQYVAKGKEIIGVAPVKSATLIDSFNTDKDIGFYTLPESHGKFYVAEATTFFIFFPEDAHRPCIKDKSAATDKKVVIKIKAVKSEDMFQEQQ